MILIAGGTGLLGSRLVALLTAARTPVRVMTRDPQRAAHLAAPGLEVVNGDVRDAAAVRRAVSGADVVVSAIQGFGGVDAGGVAAVDGVGNRVLVAESAAANVSHFVLVSIHGASANHPMELFRVKNAAEQQLRSSGLDWTIVAPTAFMETWMAIVGGASGDAHPLRIFGRGENPINFVSARDAAEVVSLAITDPALRRASIDVPGPQNLTFNEFAQALQAADGHAGPIRHVPRPMMRVAAQLLRPIRPTLAAQIAAGVVMDTYPMACDTGTLSRRWPDLPRTTLAELLASYARQAAQ